MKYRSKLRYKIRVWNSQLKITSISIQIAYTFKAKKMPDIKFQTNAIDVPKGGIKVNIVRF